MPSAIKTGFYPHKINVVQILTSVSPHLLVLRRRNKTLTAFMQTGDCVGGFTEGNAGPVIAKARERKL
jgi:hypothetical protein